MRKFGLVLGLALVMCTNLFSSTAVAAESDVEVLSEPVIHVHTANSGSCYTPVYHVCKGNTTSGGACYATRAYCGGSITGTQSSDWESCSRSAASHGTCETCGIYYDGAGAMGYHEDTNPTHNVSYYKHPTVYSCSKCGKSYTGSGTCTKATGWKKSCTKTATTIDSYTLNCSKGGTVIGRVYMTKNNVGTYTLSVASEGVTIVSVVWGDDSSDTSFYPTSDGTYTCSVTVREDNGSYYSKSLSYTVDDYDKEPPIFQSMNRYTERCTSCDIECSFSDNLSVSDYKLDKD